MTTADTPLVHELTPAAAVRAAFHDGKPGENAKLFLVNRDGAKFPDDEPLLSASAYWIAPAKPWRKLFAYFAPNGKVSGAEPVPGGYRIEGKTLAPLDADMTQAFETIRGFWVPDRYTVRLERVTVRDHESAWLPVDITDDAGTVTLWRHPAKGALVGLDRDWLRDLAGQDRPWELPGPYGHPWAGNPMERSDAAKQTGPVVRQEPGGPLKPVGVFLDRLHVIDGHYQGDPGTPERRWVGREVKPEGLMLAAVLMPRRLPNQAPSY